MFVEDQFNNVTFTPSSLEGKFCTKKKITSRGGGVICFTRVYL